MITLILCLACLVAGFIGGALVYRKNAAKIGDVQVKVEKAVSDIKK